MESASNAKNKYPGFFVLLDADDRKAYDVDEGWYECHVISPNQLLVKCDATHTIFCDDKDIETLGNFVKANNLNEDIYKSLLLHKNKWLAQAVEEEVTKTKDINKRRFKHYVLNFPEGMELSASAINPDAGKLEKCNMEMIPVAYNPFSDDLSIKNIKMSVCFEVARVDLGYVDESVKPPTPTGGSKAAAKAKAARSAY